MKSTIGVALYTLTTFCVGYGYGIMNPNPNGDDDSTTHAHHVLPSGQPRTCCEEDESSQKLLSELQNVVGTSHVITPNSSSISPYLRGMRLGEGPALCVVRPASISQAIKCLQLILYHEYVVIPQGANTGLTGGSVPRGGHSRPAVVLNMTRLDTIHPVDNGTKILCFAGAGIATAQQVAKSLGRESHSVLGSLFLNPTVAAGVAFGSGGTHMRKGPAYTDRALYVKVKEDGKTLDIVNLLGLEGMDNDDDLFDLEFDENTPSRLWTSTPSAGQASDSSYSSCICDTEANSVSRYNADTKGLEVNRSEGKVLILASVHDTFLKPVNKETYWISFADLDSALQFRKEVALVNPTDLPISMEYLDRDSFDVVDRAGRILASVIAYAGDGHDIIKSLWNLKSRIEGLPLPKANIVCDFLLYSFNNLFPEILPKRLMYLGRANDHHLMITVGEFMEENKKAETDSFLEKSSLTRFNERLSAFQEEYGDKMTIHKCASSAEADAMQVFRFVAAPSFRTWCVGTNSQGISVDYALPRNGGAAPQINSNNDNDEGSATPLKRMRYSHFGCNVVHEDIAYAPGVNVHEAKMKLKKTIEKDCNGCLPAEHGHGTEYKGTKEAMDRWMKMDPSNVMNPGIGGLKTTKRDRKSVV